MGVIASCMSSVGGVTFGACALSRIADTLFVNWPVWCGLADECLCASRLSTCSPTINNTGQHCRGYFLCRPWLVCNALCWTVLHAWFWGEWAQSGEVRMLAWSWRCTMHCLHDSGQLLLGLNISSACKCYVAYGAVMVTCQAGSVLIWQC